MLLPPRDDRFMLERGLLLMLFSEGRWVFGMTQLPCGGKVTFDRTLLEGILLGTPITDGSELWRLWEGEERCRFDSWLLLSLPLKSQMSVQKDTMFK